MAQRLRVVVDHEDGRRFGLRAGPAGAAREGAGAGRLGYREREGEAGAEAEAAALGPDAPAVSLDQALADGKSQPAADLAVAVPGGDVFAEELPEALRRDAPSLVCNRDRDMHPVAFRSDPDGSGVRAVARGVRQEVVQPPARCAGGRPAPAAGRAAGRSGRRVGRRRRGRRCGPGPPGRRPPRARARPRACRFRCARHRAGRRSARSCGRPGRR